LRNSLSLSQQITDAMKNVLELLRTTLSYRILDADTHRTVEVSGWNKDVANRKAVARYLVGLRANAIDAALNIRASLENNDDDHLEINQSVIDIVGETNDRLNDNQKRTERNPWIAEGIWHLCMAIAKDLPVIHPLGQIIAVSCIHISAKDHGLDVAALYQNKDNLFGLSIIETKAYKADPNSAISDAVNFFKGVDKGDYSPTIRQLTQNLRKFLPIEKQPLIPLSFWKHERTYLPNPHYDDTVKQDWTSSRPSFRDLKVGKPNIIVMPNSISDFDIFFDNIADEMRNFVKAL
jgi:hypothetical protein